MEFALFAPTIDWVQLVGSWSDDSIPMTRGGDGTWRVDVSLPDGRHTYRFRLPSRSPFMPGTVTEVTDPYAHMVDEWKGDASVVIVAHGEDVTTEPQFAWQHDDVPLPDNTHLVIYELHVGEFGAHDDRPGTFVSVIDRLDYLRDLGVTMVELMPVMTFPGDDSWGYNVRHPFAVEGSYGTPGDFKRLIDEFHTRGMRVILDIVFNHSEAAAPLTQIDFDYWYRQPREGVPSYGPPFDFDRHDEALDRWPARQYALDQTAFWVETYHVDGFRLDATAVMGSDDLVQAVHDIAHQGAGGKPMFVVAEELPEDPTIVGPAGPADSAWHQWFEHAVMDYLLGAEGAMPGQVLEALQPRNHGYALPSQVVNLVESHDEEPIAHRLQQAGMDDEAVFRRAKLVAALLFTAVGNPMLYQGQEFGGDRPHDQAVRPLQWGKLDGERGRWLHDHYAFFAHLRREREALTGDELTVVHADDAAAVIAWQRGSAAGKVLVVANLRDDDRSLTIPFPDGAWAQLIDGGDIDTSGGMLTDQFPAMGAKVYVHRD